MSIIGKMTKSRGEWKINPVTRVKQSKKAYDRKKQKKEAKSWINE